MQKASIFLQLAKYSREPADLLDCMALVGTGLFKRYQSFYLNKDSGACFVKEQLLRAEESDEAKKMMLEITHASTKMT